MFTRRQFALAAPAALSGCASAHSASRDPFAPASLEADIVRHAGFGDKVTGGDGDHAAAAWMAGRLARLGYAVGRQTLSVMARPHQRARLTRALDAEAALQHGSPPQVSGTIEGRLAIATGQEPHSGALRDAIALLEHPIPLDAYWPEGATAAVEQAARAGARLALARPAPGQRDAPFLFNRDDAAAPFPIPLVMAAPGVFDRLRGMHGALLGVDLPPPARSVRSDTLAATTPGFARASRRIAVSTPRTGWFACGAERGPGIAAFLALAAAAAARGRDETGPGLLLVGTTAHERGHIGMRRFLSSGAAPPLAGVDLWIHLGACIAARRGSYATPFAGVQSVLAAPELSPEEAATFAGLGFDAFPLTARSGGEGGDVFRAGGRRVRALAGLHPTFHTPQDDGAAVDPVALAAVTRAIWRMIAGPAGAGPAA